jgi:hypothetical protein
VWLAPFAAIGIRAVRGLAWWPLVAAPTVARLLDAPQTRRADRPEPPLLRQLNAVVAAAVALVCVALLPAWRPIEPGLEAPAGVVATAPPGITEALRDVATSEDRLFAPQPWASWFEFAVPEASVFVDSRIELFPAETWDDYEAIDAGDESSLELLESWEVTIVVTAAARGRTPLDDRLAAAGWRETYRDADGAVWVRADQPA